MTAGGETMIESVQRSLRYGKADKQWTAPVMLVLMMAAHAVERRAGWSGHGWQDRVINA